MAAKLYCGDRYYYVWKTSEPDLGKFCDSPSISLYNFRWHFRFSIEHEDNAKRCLIDMIHHTLPTNKNWQMSTFVELENGSLNFLSRIKRIHAMLIKTQPGYCTSVYSFWTREHRLNDSLSRRLEEARLFWSKRHENMTFVFIFEDIIESVADVERKSLLKEKLIDTRCTTVLIQDMDRLFYFKHFPDVRVKCGGRVIRAHRSVLAIRSEVFANILREGAKTVRVNANVGTLLFFLWFLYTGRFTFFSVEFAIELYQLAYYYRVETLRVECTSYIIERLAIGNICDVLELAEYSKDYLLQDEALYFVNKEDNFLSSNEWSQFYENKPELAVQVLNTILDYYHKMQGNATSHTE